jgi:hypothetical protein
MFGQAQSGWPLNCSPKTGVWGRAPISSALCAALFNSLGADLRQVEFLGSDPSSLESPQIDDLPTDGHNGFFLTAPLAQGEMKNEGGRNRRGN